jgi:hypothetical protein
VTGIRVEALLDMTTTALEDGRWTVVLSIDVRRWDLDTDLWVRLVSIQLHVASSMRWQARGDVARATDDLNAASGGLPPIYRGPAAGRRSTALPAWPATGDVLAALTWRTARVIVREQAGLAEHAARLRPGRMTPRELLVVAYIEHLRRAECDYHLTDAPIALRRGIEIDARARSLCRRATGLCRLADPLAPDVADGAWRAADGRWGLTAAAMAELAAGPVVAPTGPGSLPPGTPLRLAHVEAHRRACLWKAAVAR